MIRASTSAFVGFALTFASPAMAADYAGVVTMVGDDGLNLKGCALGFICEGETWRRAN